MPKAKNETVKLKTVKEFFKDIGKIQKKRFDQLEKIGKKHDKRFDQMDTHLDRLGSEMESIKVLHADHYAELKDGQEEISFKLDKLLISTEVEELKTRVGALEQAVFGKTQ